VIISGTMPRASGGSAFTTTAYAMGSGASLWTHRYPGPFLSTAPAAVTVSPGGQDVFVTGSSTDNGSGVVDFTTVGYAIAGGGQLWARSYQLPAARRAEPAPGRRCRWGQHGRRDRVYHRQRLGRFPQHGELHHDRLRAANGQSLWMSRYEGPRIYSNANALAVSPTGQGVFVTGEIGVHDGCCNFGTVAYQP
jgi:hypothetical protein